MTDDGPFIFDPCKAPNYWTVRRRSDGYTVGTIERDRDGNWCGWSPVVLPNGWFADLPLPGPDRDQVAHGLNIRYVKETTPQ